MPDKPGGGDLCFQSAERLAQGYRRRDFSAVEVMAAVLDRIDRLNPSVNAYVTVVGDQAMEAARAAQQALDAGRPVGPLHGVPVSIKDVTPTKGIRTTWASKLYENHVPDEDSLAVERLKAAGAIIVGKTNTPEFAAGGHTFNSLFGPTRNPWNLALSAGGSSGGAAAAVATGMGPLAEGSDLGGSLRTPAAFCGVVGFRGSPGLVPIYPSAMAWNSMTVQGPIARTVGDVALMLRVLAGPDDRDPMSYDVDTQAFTDAARAPAIAGARIAWTPDLNGLIPVDPEIVAVAGESVHLLRSLGATVDEACPSFAELDDIVRGTRGVAMVGAHAAKLERWRDQMQSGLVWNIEQGLALTPQDIARAEIARTTLWHRVRAFMTRYDFMILPGTAVAPFPVEIDYPTEIAGRTLGNYMEWFYLTYAISVTALPVICVPCGFTKSGLPVGLQIVGRRRQEARLLAAAAAFEQACPWSQWRPPVLADHGIFDPGEA
jgi:amidase